MDQMVKHHDSRPSYLEIGLKFWQEEDKFLLENWETEIGKKNYPAIGETYSGKDKSRLTIYMNTMAEKVATDGVGRDPVTGQNPYDKGVKEIEKYET